jgi:RHS repeat-associated protein
MDPLVLTYSGALLARVEQGGRGWRYSYDGGGRLQVVRDTLGRMTTFSYDAADRDTTEVLLGGRTVRYGYDSNGNVTSLTLPGGSTHTFGYSSLDMMDTYTPPSISGVADPATRYSFNGDRQLTRVTRPDGTVISAHYVSSTGLADSLTELRGRDPYTYWPDGQLLSAGSPDGVTVTYGYDGPLPRSESWAGLYGGGVVESVSVRSNIAFNDSSQTINGSNEASYSYDTDGLLTSATVNSATETISRRSDDGLISGTSIGNVTSANSYNSHGELWKLSYAWSGGGSFQQVLDRDSLGRIVKVAESGISSHTYDYHYDAAGQLDSVAVDGSKLAGYTYDPNGNRAAWRGPTAADTATATYDAQDRLLRYGATAYLYTANGELTRMVGVSLDTTRYTYDAFGNLTGAHLPSGDSLVYLVDGENRRVARILNGTRTNTWLYQNRLNVIAELDGSGALVNRYVYATQAHVPDLVVRSGVTYRLITDQLGSVRAVVKVSDGTVVQQMDYDAWGVRTTDTAPSLQALGYAGGLSDASTGLVRFGARDYDPSVGRWTAKDPVVFAGGQEDLYAYANSDPVGDTDPSGLETAAWACRLEGTRGETAYEIARRLRNKITERARQLENEWRHVEWGHEFREEVGPLNAVILGEPANVAREAWTTIKDPRQTMDSITDIYNTTRGLLGETVPEPAAPAGPPVPPRK